MALISYVVHDSPLASGRPWPVPYRTQSSLLAGLLKVEHHCLLIKSGRGLLLRRLKVRGKAREREPRPIGESGHPGLGQGGDGTFAALKRLSINTPGNTEADCLLSPGVRCEQVQYSI